MTIRKRRRSFGSEIREFVYLDETSVESLLASVDGEILVQRTDTQSKSRESSMTAGISKKTHFGQASFAPTLKTVRGTEVQELRKSVAQSAFARFRAKNISKFALLPRGSVRVGPIDKFLLGRRAPRTMKRLGQGIPLKDLKRGDLLEIDTDLVASDIYKARTAMSAVTSVVESFPTFLTIELRDALKNARPLTELIDSLTGNAIPVVGQNPGIAVLDVQGEPWLVNASILSSGPTNAAELALESVANPRWFWGDVGRILFRQTRFTMLCRVVNPALTNAESGSYVGSILRTINDDLAETVDGLGTMFLGALRSGHNNNKLAPSGGPLDPALLDYAARIQELAGRAEAPVPIGMSEFFGGQRLKGLNVDAQTAAFKLTDQLAQITDEEVGIEKRLELREAMRELHGLWPWSPVASQKGSSEPDDDLNVRFLEVAIVAVYW